MSNMKSIALANITVAKSCSVTNNLSENTFPTGTIPAKKSVHAVPTSTVSGPTEDDLEVPWIDFD